jgi:hypothetical protein
MRVGLNGFARLNLLEAGRANQEPLLMQDIPHFAALRPAIGWKAFTHGPCNPKPWHKHSIGVEMSSRDHCKQHCKG